MMGLGSHIAVAVVQAGSYSSDLTSSLGTSLCHGYTVKSNVYTVKSNVYTIKSNCIHFQTCDFSECLIEKTQVWKACSFVALYEILNSIKKKDNLERIQLLLIKIFKNFCVSLKT